MHWFMYRLKYLKRHHWLCDQGTCISFRKSSHTQEANYYFTKDLSVWKIYFDAFLKLFMLYDRISGCSPIYP